MLSLYCKDEETGGEIVKKDTIAVINFALNNLIRQTEKLLERDKEEIEKSEDTEKKKQAEENYKRHYKDLEKEHEAVNDFRRYIKRIIEEVRKREA